MPDKAAIHLPSMLTAKAVYERMKEDFEIDQRIVVSLAQFYHLWSEFYSHVTIPTVSVSLLQEINEYACIMVHFNFIGKPLCKVRHVLHHKRRER